jgi:hypothetical protein
VNKHLTFMAIFIVMAGMDLVETVKTNDAIWMFGFIFGFVMALRFFLKWKESEAETDD